MKILRTCIDSIFAGAMIAIGAVIYLNCPNRIVGAFLFSIGLIVIMEFEFNLYTGKVGFAKTVKDSLRLVLIFIMNAIGCSLIFLLPTNDAINIWTGRLDYPLYVVFMKAVVCGILIYVCVHQHKINSREVSILTTLVAIPAFILCGAEHSIADICFMLAARQITLEGITFILIVAIGNAVGSLAFSLWISKRNELHQNNKNRYSQWRGR